MIKFVHTYNVQNIYKKNFTLWPLFMDGVQLPHNWLSIYVFRIYKNHILFLNLCKILGIVFFYSKRYRWIYKKNLFKAVLIYFSFNKYIFLFSFF